MQHGTSDDESAGGEVAGLSRMAWHHFRRGHLQRASEVCERLLGERQCADALLLLGMIAQRQRDFETAVERYRQFLDINPNHAQARGNLGLALNRLGRADLAVAHLEKSIALAGDGVAVHAQLGDAYARLQRWEDAARAYQRVLAMQPDHGATLAKLGNVLLAAQHWTNAIQRCEQALALRPRNARLHRRLGAALHGIGQTQRAAERFQQALRLRPDYGAARIDLALALRQLGRTQDALMHLRKAIDLRPDDIDAHINLALTLRQQGRAELAIAGLQRLLTLRPGCGPAYYHLSTMQPEAELMPALKKLLSDPNLPNEEAVHCHFALGNCLDRRKSFAQAFSHYRKANALERQSFAYDARDNSRLFERLMNVYSTRFLQDKRGLGCASQVPVFIVGLPRSGTTLVEQIASSHALVHGAGEIHAFSGVNRAIAEQLRTKRPAPECMSDIDGKTIEKYAAQYLQELTARAPTAARITDKLPGNFVRIGLIKTLFPNARIICCQRNPLDNCIALFFHCFKALKCSFQLAELGQYCLDHQRLMSHWESLFPGQLLKVQYEELVMAQERVSRQIIDYLGLEWDENCLDFHNNGRVVMSPSSLQVRQPMHGNSIDRWKPYAAHLQPLIETLRNGGERATAPGGGS